MIKVLSYYTLRELIPPVVISLLFFTAVLLLAQLLDMANVLLRAGVSGAVVLQLLGIIIVTLLAFSVPMAVLLGVLIGVGRLASENEILAIRVSGIPIARVFVPTLFAALLLSGGLVLANNYVIPRMAKGVESILYEMQINVLTNLKPGQFYDDLGSDDMEMTLHFDEVVGDPGQEPRDFLEMEGVNMRMQIDRTELLPGNGRSVGDIEFLIFSKRGAIHPDPYNQAIELTLENGTWLPLGVRNPDADVTAGNEEAGRTTVMRFGKLETQFGGFEVESVENADPRVLGLSELWSFLQNPPGAPRYKDESRSELRRDWRRYYAVRNELLQRFSLPFSVFAFTLIAIPLAIEVRPRAKSFAVLLALGLMLFYYVLMSFGSAIGASGVSWALAILAAMMPNIVLGIIGIILLWRATQR